MDLLEAVSNLLEWWDAEANHGLEFYEDDTGPDAQLALERFDDLNKAVEGIEVFRFKAPQDIITQMEHLRYGLVRDNVLDTGQYETHLGSFDHIIQEMKDTLREKEKPSEAEFRLRIEGYLAGQGMSPTMIDSFIDDEKAMSTVHGLVDTGMFIDAAISQVVGSWDEGDKPMQGTGVDNHGVTLPKPEVEDVEEDCPLCNTRHTHVGVMSYCHIPDDKDVSPGDTPIQDAVRQTTGQCDRCHKQEKVEGEAYCQSCLSLQCDSCHEFHGDFPDGLSASLKTAGFEVLSGSGAINKLLEVLGGGEEGGDLDDEVEHDHRENMVRGVEKDPARFSVQMALQVERHRLELNKMHEHIDSGVELMKEVKELLLVKTPAALIKVDEKVKELEVGRERSDIDLFDRLARSHEVINEALITRVADVEANQTRAAEEREGTRTRVDTLWENVEGHEAQLGDAGAQLARLKSQGEGDGIRIARLEMSLATARQEAIDVLAGRLKTLENMYLAHRQLLRHVPVGEEEVAHSG